MHIFHASFKGGGKKEKMWSNGLDTNTVILKLTQRHKTESTDRAAADCADLASVCRFRSFRRFHISSLPNFPVMLMVLDH